MALIEMAEAKYERGDMVATRDGYGDALLELGAMHEEIVALDADLAKSTKSLLFGKKYPERFRYIGISEADMVSMAAGLARCGKVPFASSFASFVLNRALDQIRVTVAYSRTNVKIIGSHGGILTGEDGPTGQEIMDIAAMRSMPNFSVLVPADYYETIACTYAMHGNDGPFYMRTCREKTQVLHDGIPEFRPGKAEILVDGPDAAIIACGGLVEQALAAAQALKARGVSASVVNCASIKPFDSALVAKEAGKGVVVTAEDGVVNGLGSAVAEVIAERGLGARLLRVGLHDTFAESGKPRELLRKYRMDADAIAECALQGLEGDKK